MLLSQCSLMPPLYPTCEWTIGGMNLPSTKRDCHRPAAAEVGNAAQDSIGGMRVLVDNKALAASLPLAPHASASVPILLHACTVPPCWLLHFLQRGRICMFYRCPDLIPRLWINMLNGVRPVSSALYGCAMLLMARQVHSLRTMQVSSHSGDEEIRLEVLVEYTATGDDVDGTPVRGRHLSLPVQLIVQPAIRVRTIGPACPAEDPD